MKLLRVALCSLCFSLPAQSPEHSNALLILRAHLAFNDFAKLANAWSDQHSDYLMSRQDSQRLEDAMKGWERFRGLAIEAQLINKKGKAIR